MYRVWWHRAWRPILRSAQKAGAPSFSRSVREGGAFRSHAPAVILRKRRPSRSEGLPTKDLCTSAHGHGTVLPETKARSRWNLAGQRVVVSSLACIRWSAAARSAKSPARSQRTREWRGTRFACGESLGQPPWISPTITPVMLLSSLFSLE